MVDLIESGVVDGSRKNVNRGHAVYTFAGGSHACTRSSTATRRRTSARSTTPTIRDHRSATTAWSRSTTPRRSTCRGRRRRVRRPPHLTGTGGRLQFVRGAYASRGGKRLHLPRVDVRAPRAAQERIVLTSAGQRGDHAAPTPCTSSRVRPREPQGEVLAERATALISIAHPDFRGELEREARRVVSSQALGVDRRPNRFRQGPGRVSCGAP